MHTTERFEKVNIDKLVPYARNARTHSKEQILQLRASLREFGFVNPVMTPVTDSNGKITDVKIEYCSDYLGQMMEYGKNYSFLPAW